MALGAEGFERSALDITAMGDGHDHFLALNQILVFEPVPCGRDFGNTRRGELIAHFLQFLAHYLIQLHAVSQQREIIFDLVGKLFQLIANLVPA